MTIQATLRHGDSGSITGQVVAVHPAGPDKETEAVEIETISGTSGWVLFAPDSPGRQYQWELDYWYRLHHLVGCDPQQALQTRTERVKEALSPLSDTDVLPDDEFDEPVCPVCGGDADVTDALQIDPDVRGLLNSRDGEVHGIGQNDVTVESLGSDAIDWRPQSESRQRQRRRTGSDVECLECGENVTSYYREQIEEKRRQLRAQNPDERPDAEGDVLESVQHNEAPVMDSAAPAAAGGGSAASAEVGMATGGAKDAANFRDNIQDGYVPKPDALAYEGLFYDYYFDTGNTRDGDSLFYPSYAKAVTESPVTDELERYMTVGLNSNLTEADLERKPLNLVAVVDVSGSMSSQFDQYYYDEHGNRQEATADGPDTSKMAAARQALSALTEQLRDEDRLGVVLYNNNAHVAKPLRRVGDTNMDAIRDHIQTISAGGGTDMSAGFDAAMDLLEPHQGADLTEVENRIVFMTDAMPNTGMTDRDDIVDSFDAAAEEHVHTTFVGIGLDTNADLVESISGVRGANHYFVHSTEEFKQRLADEFTYMVTPLVFDLSLDVVSEGYEIEAVYGSPNAEEATGEVMHVTTLFPSPTSDGETRGGVTLVELSETEPDASLELVATWTERDGTQGRDVAELSFPSATTDHFDNKGIRKAVLLSRYGRLLREWMAAVRQDGTGSAEGAIDDWNHPDEVDLGEWEDQSVPLSVSELYETEFNAFREYMVGEVEEIGDETLSQEVDILELLCDSATQSSSEVGKGLTEEEISRLKDLVELQPTSNSELQTEWGLDESADVHHYLEEHLAEFYYRDGDNRIRATDEADRRLA